VGAETRGGLEDELDLAAAREALKELGEVPWETVKAKLGIVCPGST